MKSISVFITTLFICITFSFELVFAQDTNGANIDSLQSPDDSVQVRTKKEAQLKKFKKAFQKLVRMEEAENEQTQNKTVEDPDLNIMGFVVDETRSPFGRTFYELFYRAWESPHNASYYTIKISERPMPGRGSQIIITMNYEKLLRFRLQPKYHFIEKVSKQAAAYVKKVLKKSSVKGKLLF